MDNKIAIELYEAGLTIRQVADKLNVSYETARKTLKASVKWRKNYLSDLTKDEINNILERFDAGETVCKIAQDYDFSGPAISRLLRANNRVPDCSSKRYDIIRETPLNKQQKQFIIGHLLGDGCLYRDGKNSTFKMTVAQCKKQELYFHWKVAMMDPFINCWRESVDKRDNSIMLQTTTICHKELNRYAQMFYGEDRIKIVPKDIANHMTALSLAVWIMDDGNLNSGVNMRIATMSFTYDENVLLQGVLYSLFDIRSKVMGFKYKGKQYWQLTLNKDNTQKLSDLIRPYVIESMSYKIMPRSSTTEC